MVLHRGSEVLRHFTRIVGRRNQTAPVLISLSQSSICPSLSVRACATTSKLTTVVAVRELLTAAESNPAIYSELEGMIEKDIKTRANLERLMMQHTAQDVLAPDSVQLRKIASAAALPFVAFGFLDNFIMISIGDVLDTTLCVSCGLSTMAAAGLGNTFSDVFGIISGGIVEDTARSMGFEAPPLSKEQSELPVTKRWERAGQIIGIVFGCFLGMVPLLFLDPNAAEKLKREQRLDDMYTAVVDHLANMLGAEYAKLMLVDQHSNSLYTLSSSQDDSMPSTFAKRRPNSQHMDQTRLPILEGSIAAKAIQTGNFFNIADLPNSEHYQPKLHDNYRNTGRTVQSILVMPIFGFDATDGIPKPIGVLQVVNKKAAEKFSRKDENVVAALCSHIATGLNVSGAHEQANGFLHILSMCERTLTMKGVRLNAAENIRMNALYGQVMSDITNMLDVAATQLLVHDESSDTLVMKVSDKIPWFTSPPHKGIMGKVFDQGKTIVVNKLRHSPYYDPDRHDDYRGTGIVVKAVIATPCVSTDGKILGVLECFKDKDDTFASRDVLLLESVAAALAINLEGNGASLRKALAEIHKLHSSAQKADTCDCSSEVENILASMANLIQKAGGNMNSLESELHLKQFLDRHSSRDTS